MQTVYIDMLFLINFAVDYLALVLTAKICAVPIARPRAALGAVLGAGYSAMVFFEPFYFMTHPAVKIACGILMALTVFGGKSRFWRPCLVFFAVSAAFGGAVLASAYFSGGSVNLNGEISNVTLKILVFSFALSYAVFSLIFKRSARNAEGGGIAEVTVELGERRVKFKALCDTGNSLSDPITGKGVAVTDVATLLPLFDAPTHAVLTDENVKNPIKLMEAAQKGKLGLRLRLVPYKAIGVSNGMLAAFLPDRIYVNGRLEKNMLVAFSPDCVTDGGAYSALIGGNCA